jgi:predicted AAA+ superfamily ATPase
METTDVFEEWDSYAKRKQLLPREISLDSLISGSKTKIAALTGIRRSGKSSVLMLIAQKLQKEGKNARYINVEDSRIREDREVLDKALKWFGEDGYLLLDEITSAHGWEGWLARVHELLKGRLRIIVSSSRRGLSQPGKPLRGRLLPFELYPLSFREFLAFKGVEAGKTVAARGGVEKAFAEYMRYGGFPEVVLAKEDTDKVRILDSYFRDIVGLDIAEVSGGEIATVEAFARYAVQSPYFSASKCLNFLSTLGHKIGKEKILSLERHAQAGYLFFFVPIFSYNIKDRSQYPRKAYCGDSGFFYGVAGRTDLGRLYENIAFLELKRRLQGQKEICYWKNRQGLETDFVVRWGSEVSEAMQVVYELGDEKTRKREVEGIVGCAKEVKAGSAMIITKDVAETKTVEGVKIRFVPMIDWLLG